MQHPALHRDFERVILNLEAHLHKLAECQRAISERQHPAGAHVHQLGRYLLLGCTDNRFSYNKISPSLAPIRGD